MYRPDYKGTAALLSKALASRDILIPPNEILLAAFTNYFEDNDMYLAASIMGTVNTARDWHYIELGEIDKYRGSFDLLNASESLQSAIGAIIDEVDDTHIYPDTIRANSDSIEFRKNGELMYRVGKIKFSEVSPSQLERVRTQFKGIRKFGDKARLVKRLQSIPNFESLITSAENSVVPGGRSMVAMVENFPIFLRAMLSDRFNVDIKQSVALEIVAEMFGAKSWNVFKASADKIPTDYRPIYIDFNQTENKPYQFYKNSFEGLVGFSQVLSEYRDRDKLVAEFRGSYHSDSIYFAAYNSQNDVTELEYTTHKSEFSLSGPQLIEVSEGDVHLSWVNDINYTEVAERLSEMMKVSDTLSSRLNSTKGRNQQETLFIGNYLFTLIDSGDGFNFLKVQVVDTENMDVDLKSGFIQTPVYKSILTTIKEGTLLLDEYGEKKRALFEGMSEIDTLRLSNFSGIKRNQHAIYLRN